MLVDGYDLKCRLCNKKFFSIGKEGVKKLYLAHIRKEHPEKIQQAEILIGRLK